MLHHNISIIYAFVYNRDYLEFMNKKYKVRAYENTDSQWEARYHDPQDNKFIIPEASNIPSFYPVQPRRTFTTKEKAIQYAIGILGRDVEVFEGFNEE